MENKDNVTNEEPIENVNVDEGTVNQEVQEENEETSGTNPLIDNAVDEETLNLLSHFAKTEDVNTESEQWQNSPEYREFMEWKQQRMQQQQQDMQTPTSLQNMDIKQYENALKDPKEFRNLINNIHANYQAQLMGFAGQIIEAAELLYHLKEYEEKFPEISEHPQALQVAISKAKALGLSPKQTIDKAVDMYRNAYKIRNDIIKNKGVQKDVTDKKIVKGKTPTRDVKNTTNKEESPFDFILNAYKD